MTITNVGSIEIVVYPSGSSPTSITTLPAPLTSPSLRLDSSLPLLGRVSAIPVSTQCTLQPIENRVPQQFSFIQVRLAKAFLKSRDGGGCWMLSLNYTAFLCSCIGFTLLFPAVFLMA